MCSQIRINRVMLAFLSKVMDNLKKFQIQRNKKMKDLKHVKLKKCIKRLPTPRIW